LTNISVPDRLRQLFTKNESGFGNTIACAFDIQPRNYELMSFDSILNASLFPGSVPMAMEYIFLDDKIEAIEGLIVDTRVGNASVGFRNHTLP